jgi:hypothetical protein
MLRRVALVRTDVSEELRASFIRVTRIGELGTTLAVTSNRRIFRIYAKFEVFTAVTMKHAVFWDIKPLFFFFTGSILFLRYRAQPVNIM